MPVTTSPGLSEAPVRPATASGDQTDQAAGQDRHGVDAGVEHDGRDPVQRHVRADLRLAFPAQQFTYRTGGLLLGPA
jgi:hypothetical protein